MKPIRFHELVKRVGMASQTCSSIYLEQGNIALTEDLLIGFVNGFRSHHESHSYSISSARELSAELQNYPADGHYRVLIVRDAHKIFTSKNFDSLLMQLDAEKRNNRLRVMFVGDEPIAEVKEWFLSNKSYGEVNEPSPEKLGNWVAAKTAGKYEYRKVPEGAVISAAMGLALMEHVGWSYVDVLQAAKALHAYAHKLEWEFYTEEQMKELIPRQAGYGYADSLVFGAGRRGALQLSEGVSDVIGTLELIRHHLKVYGLLRALEVEGMSDRKVSEATKVPVWIWRTKYKYRYASFTNDRIRMRLALVEEAIVWAKTGTGGVLELLATKW